MINSFYSRIFGSKSFNLQRKFYFWFFKELSASDIDSKSRIKIMFRYWKLHHKMWKKSLFLWDFNLIWINQTHKVFTRKQRHKITFLLMLYVSYYFLENYFVMTKKDEQALKTLKNYLTIYLKNKKLSPFAGHFQLNNGSIETGFYNIFIELFKDAELATFAKNLIKVQIGYLWYFFTLKNANLKAKFDIVEDFLKINNSTQEFTSYLYKVFPKTYNKKIRVINKAILYRKFKHI